MVSFEGAFIAPDFSNVVDLIEAWLGTPRVKARIIGEELVYRDDLVYVYCHSAVGYPGPEERIIVEGTVVGDLDSISGLLRSLAEACEVHGVSCSLACYPIDEHGTIIGDGIEFQAPPEETSTNM